MEIVVLPIGPLFWLIALLFPLILTLAVVYPVFIAWRFFYLAKHGRTSAFDSAADRFFKFLLIAGPVMYLLLILAVFVPKLAPAVSNFVAGGGLAFVVPLIFINYILAFILSEGNALRLHAARVKLP